MIQKGILGVTGQYPTFFTTSRFTGRVFYVDAKNGGDGNDGSANRPFGTLAFAFAACLAGNNDVIVIVSDGTTASSQRLTANFNWNKAATHLIGVCSGNGISNRARIAPLSGTPAFANFFTVSVDGCYFQDLEFFQGFTAGTPAEICLTVTGGRNRFVNCHFAGPADTDGAGAQDAGSRVVKIGSAGSGENLFENCIIGDDTIARTVANASVEFTGGTPRNVFRDCLFPILATNAAVLGILGTGAACMDRFQLFERCKFINSLKSTGVAMTALASLTSASPGGLLFFKDCSLIGATKWGDTNGLANSYIDMPAVSAAAGGLSLNPS